MCFYDDKGLQFTDGANINVNISDKRILALSSTTFGKDFQHGFSPLKQSFTNTNFQTDLSWNFRYLNTRLVELAMMIYKNSDVFKLIDNSMIRILEFPLPFEYSNFIIFGSTIKDIVRPPKCMFLRPSNYQICLKEMGALIDYRSHRSMNSVRKDVFEFLKSHGVFNLPDQVLSGSLHCTWPNHGKGWHHNIENVPHETVDVTYFSMTDKNEFGGSFFFYRHPISHALHAVPDIHGTTKQFYLTSNPKCPLWHALCSFTAHRLSFGLSKKSDMETARPQKYNLQAILQHGDLMNDP
jgi:hypothetical protein